MADKVDKGKRFWNIWGELIILLLFILVGVGIHLGINAFVYGDPLCAFKTCVDVKGAGNGE